MQPRGNWTWTLVDFLSMFAQSSVLEQPPMMVKQTWWDVMLCYGCYSHLIALQDGNEAIITNCLSNDLWLEACFYLHKMNRNKWGPCPTPISPSLTVVITKIGNYTDSSPTDPYWRLQNDSVKCYSGGHKIVLIPPICELLLQPWYHCAQYPSRQHMSIISHC